MIIWKLIKPMNYYITRTCMLKLVKILQQMIGEDY